MGDLAVGITSEHDYEKIKTKPGKSWDRNSAFEPCRAGTTFMESAEQLNQGLRQKRRDLGLPEEWEDLCNDDGVSFDGLEEALEQCDIVVNETLHNDTVDSSLNSRKNIEVKKKRKSNIKKKNTLAIKKHMTEKKKLNRSVIGRTSFKKYKNKNFKGSCNRNATNTKKNSRNLPKKNSKKQVSVTTTKKKLTEKKKTKKNSKKQDTVTTTKKVLPEKKKTKINGGKQSN